MEYHILKNIECICIEKEDGRQAYSPPLVVYCILYFDACFICVCLGVRGWLLSRCVFLVGHLVSHRSSTEPQLSSFDNTRAITKFLKITQINEVKTKSIASISRLALTQSNNVNNH